MSDEESTMLFLGPPDSIRSAPPPLRLPSAQNGDDDLMTMLSLGLILPNAKNGGSLALQIVEPAAPPSSVVGSEQPEYLIPTIVKILDGPPQVSCPVCSRAFNKYYSLKKHIMVHGEEYSNEVKSLQGEFLERSLSCYCCVKRCNKSINFPSSKPVKNFKILQAHFKRKHDTMNFVCWRCNVKFSMLNDWIMHERRCMK